MLSAHVWAVAATLWIFKILDVFVIWAFTILFKRICSRSRWPEKMTYEKKKSGF